MKCNIFITEGLILAQSERWRRVLGMQVDRQHVCSNTDDGERQTGEYRVGIYPGVWDSQSKGWVISDDTARSKSPQGDTPG